MEFSEDFEVAAEAGKGDGWRTESRSELEVGFTEEFGGSFEGPAPENYLAVSLLNCFIATFKAIAGRSGLEYSSVSAEGTLKVRPSDGDTEVRAFEAKFEVETPDPEKARTMMETAENHCFVMNTVDVEKDLSFETVDSRDQ